MVTASSTIIPPPPPALDVAVDLGLLDAGVGDGPLRGEHVVLHAVEVRDDGIVGQSDADDDRCSIHSPVRLLR